MNHPDRLDTFETALLNDLKTRVNNGDFSRPVQRPAAPSRRRLAALGAATASIATIGAVAAGVFEPAAAAYTVATGPGGSVIVTIHNLTDSHGLEDALAARGIRADVSYLPSRPATGGGTPAVAASGQQQLSSSQSQVTGTAALAPGSPTVRNACGTGGRMPFTAGPRGSDYVVDIPAGSPLLQKGRVLHVNSTGTSTGPVSGLTVTWNDRGVDCGAGTVQVSAAGTH